MASELIDGVSAQDFLCIGKRYFPLYCCTESVFKQRGVMHNTWNMRKDYNYPISLLIHSVKSF